jgi:hypothetical protein
MVDSHVARTAGNAAYPAFPEPDAGLSGAGTHASTTTPEPAPDRRTDAAPEIKAPSADTAQIEPPKITTTCPFPETKSLTDHPIVAALQCRLDKRPEEARRLLEKYDARTHEFLFGLLGLMARFAEPPPSKSQSPDAGEIIEELRGLMDPLRPRAPLKIEKMCFCNRIKTFGVYEPMADRIQFRPDDHVQVYVELRNFATSERRLPNGDVRHVINLRSSYEIHDENRQPVFEDVFLRERDAADESRTQRNDYFENYVFTVPKLKPGFYTVWIKVEDLGTEPPRTAKRSLDFQVPSTPAQVTRGND